MTDNEEDRIELLRRRIAEDVSQSVESSLRKRYSWIGMITAFILGGLGYGLMENVLRGASDSIVRAELVLDDVEKQLTKVDERTDQKMAELDRFVDTSSGRLEALDERIANVARVAEERMKQVDALLTARERDLENLGNTAQRINDLTEQFAELNTVGGLC